MAIPEGFGFVPGRSGDKARELLAAADEAKLDRKVAVRTTVGGYYVDERLLGTQDVGAEPDQSAVPEASPESAPQSSEEEAAQAPEPPAKNASKSDWEDFAKEHHGYDPSEGLTRNELVERYGE